MDQKGDHVIFIRKADHIILKKADINLYRFIRRFISDQHVPVYKLFTYKDLSSLPRS